MPLINCKRKLKLKWPKYCVLSAAGNYNGNDKYDKITFTIRGTKLHVPVVTLSARDNRKLSKLLIKEFERSVYLNEYKTKSKNKIQQMNLDIFKSDIYYLLLDSIDCLL